MLNLIRSVRRRLASVVSTALLTALILSVFAGLLPAQAQAQSPLCRFGVNVDVAGSEAVDDITDMDVGPLRAGWYIDYHARQTPSRPGGIEFAQVINLGQGPDRSFHYSPKGADLLDIIDANPGAIWFIGNEPDRRGYQDDIEPDVYARAYGTLYALIKARDATARVYPGSIVQATELRLKYLNIVLDTYLAEYGRAMPVDGWSIHGFILREVSESHPTLSAWGAGIPPGLDDLTGLVINVRDNDSVALFVQQIERFRQWMADNGYRNVPLILSEYGVLMPDGFKDEDGRAFDHGRVNAFMDTTFDYLLNTRSAQVGYPLDDNRLVQRLSWYSTNDKNFNGWLFDTDNALNRSLMGDNYVSYTADVKEELDFFPNIVRVLPAKLVKDEGTANLTLQADIVNQGNSALEQQATVRFYDGDPSAGGQQIGADQIVRLTGCADVASVSVQWNNVPPERYEIYVVVESNSPLSELNPSNNIKSHSFFFGEHFLFLPNVRW